MGQDTLRLTSEQRIAALERENVVLHGKTKVLHGMLKEQRRLIHEYIREALIAADQDKEMPDRAQPKEALCALGCKPRLERVEHSLNALQSCPEDRIVRCRAV